MMAPAHCKKCGAPMDKVADIPPQGRELGLRAFLCPECGAVDSVLIHPDTHFEPNDKVAPFIDRWHHCWGLAAARKKQRPPKAESGAGEPRVKGRGSSVVGTTRFRCSEL